MTDTATRAAIVKAGLGAGDVYRRAVDFIGALGQAGGLAAFNEGAWYYGEAGAEVWHYGGPTREEAVEHARDAEVAFVAFGQKGLTRFSLDADDLIQNALDGGLEEEFGETGEHDLCDVSKEAIAELQVMLDAAVTAWVIRHWVTAFNFVDCREERIDGSTAE